MINRWIYELGMSRFFWQVDMMMKNALKDFFGGLGRGVGLFVTTRPQTSVYSANMLNKTK